tara:strand:- start:27460 stop:28047 length:588 start_codon:yes stop_codon:yes gene_type:complete
MALRGGIKGIRVKKSGLLFLDAGCQFVIPNKIFFGKGVTIGRYCKLSGLSLSGIEFGDNVSIGDFSNVIVSTSYNNIGVKISLGHNVGVGEYSYIGGGGGVEIGSSCIIGQYFSVHPENHNFMDSTMEIREQGVSRKGVKIGSNCWIGSKVTVLDGAIVGSGCVIAAGTVVRGCYPDDVVIAGVPSRIIKSRIKE